MSFLHVSGRNPPDRYIQGQASHNNEIYPVNTSIDEMEKAHIMNVIHSVKGNISQASRILGIARQHLRKKLKKYLEEKTEVENLRKTS